MFLPLSSIFAYLSASPSSRCIVEGEALLAANHLIVCGVKSKSSDGKWDIVSYCLQTSALKSDPHEINGILITSNKVEIASFTCSCKAGASESCKHVAATLLFCSRKSLEELQELSSTDIGCVWKTQKNKTVDKYLPRPLKDSHCFNPLKKSSRSRRVRSEVDVDNLFQMATSLLPNSSFALHREGRQKNVKFISSNISTHVTEILHNSEESAFIKNLDLQISSSRECCKKLLESFKEESVLGGLCCKQGTQEWKEKRKNRITGSTCYSIFTFKKSDWTKMLYNFFNPVSVITKEMRHGLEQESWAFEAFARMNPNLEIKNVGVLICKKYPWFAYSPDGVIFENSKPSRLLEIKCPYLGQFETGPTVISTLQYLDENCKLKQHHSYYAQIQLGMALLNLNKCEFIIYFSKEKNYLQISVPFNSNFAKELMETVSKKYINNMIHYLCN